MNEQEKAIPKITDAEKGATMLPVSSVLPEGIAYYLGFGEHGAKRPLDDKLIPYAAALRFDKAFIEAQVDAKCVQENKAQ